MQPDLHRPFTTGALRADGAGKPEIDHTHPTVRIDHGVRRLEVSMHDPRRMRRVQRLCSLVEGREDLVMAARAIPQPGPQADAGEQLHREVHALTSVPRIKPTDVENRNDVRMAQRGHGLCLPNDPRARLFFGAAQPRPTFDELQRNLAIEVGVVGPPNRCTGALADGLEEEIPANVNG